MTNHSIRELNPRSEEEISLVASRMRETLVEVLGEEKGTALYTMGWLINRVRWHLDPQQTIAKIFLVENPEIVGHAIVRIEHDEHKNAYGYFSTIYVEPTSRNKKIGSELIHKAESWLIEMKMSKIVYHTAENHARLIALFNRHGYRVTHRESGMVQLSKSILTLRN